MKRILWLIVAGLLPVSAQAASVEDLEQYRGWTVTDIRIVGNNVTKERIITREFLTEVGQPLSPDKVRDEAQRLDNLGIFAEIVVVAEEYEGGVALEWRVRELPWIIPYVKFKYTEQNGWSVGPTLSSVNMLGRDISVSGFALFGGTTTYSLRFNHPWIVDTRVSLDFIGEHLQRTNTFYDFKETTDEFTVWLGKWIGIRGRTRLGFSYFGVESDKDGRTLQSDNHDNMFRIGGAIGYDSRDGWQNPHSGWQNELEVMGTGGVLGGDADFVTATVDLRRWQPIRDDMTLAAGLLTTMQGGTVGEDIPIYMQYNMGGANTIRGWDVDKLGPVLFGKNQLIFTAEYQILLMPVKAYDVLRWAVSGGLEMAFFADVGTAWSTSDEFTSERFKGGFGVGLRPLVPAVNVLRLDLGFNTQGDVLFHFGIWSKFDAQRQRLR